ncbi:MAG: hypothetical protein J6R77_06605 [Clostridia bacterium]|nr:hypothetical protein [Clostridia bacterium]
MKLRLLCLLLVFTFILSGCRKELPPEEMRYDIPENFIQLPFYSMTEGERLGQNHAYPTETVYTLEGLPREQFLCLKKGNDKTSLNYLWIQKDAAEPILQYEVEKVEITQTGNETMTLTDKTLITRLFAGLRDGDGQKIEDSSPKLPNASAHFALPCELIWLFGINVDEEGRALLFYHDAKKDEWYQYDVTDILSGIEGLVLPSPHTQREEPET